MPDIRDREVLARCIAQTFDRPIPTSAIIAMAEGYAALARGRGIPLATDDVLLSCVDSPNLAKEAIDAMMQLIGEPSAAPVDTHPEPEPEQVDGETRLMRRYVELGRISRDADAEREAIKTQEIEPAMADGIMFSDGDQVLVWEFSERITFDHKAARKNGDISDEVWQRYVRVDVQRKLISRKRDADGKLAEQQRLRLLRHAADLEMVADALLGDLGRYVEADTSARGSASNVVNVARQLLAEIRYGGAE